MKIRQELESGSTCNGVPLGDEHARQRLAKLRRRASTMTARYRVAELARINELEQRFVGHLTATANDVKAHVDIAIEPLITRAEGRVPPRREGQTAAARKVELGLVMSGLRHERKRLVEEERAARPKRRGAEPEP